VTTRFRLRVAASLLAAVFVVPACGGDDGTGVRTIDEGSGSGSASGSASGSGSASTTEDAATEAAS
jgi:hypothetical protein